jgi:hypothetical protein
MTETAALAASLTRVVAEDPGVVELFSPAAKQTVAALTGLAGTPDDPSVAVTETSDRVEVVASIGSDATVPSPETLRRLADKIRQEFATELGPDRPVTVRIRVSSIS